VESAQPAGAFWQIQCAARGTYLQSAEHCLRTNFGRRAKEKAGAAKDMTTDYKERIRKVAAALLRRKAIPAERRPKREGKPSTEFVETVFTYDGHWTPGAKCGLQIFPGTDGIPVVVLTELPDNVNTSVTNLIACIPPRSLNSTSQRASGAALPSIASSTTIQRSQSPTRPLTSSRSSLTLRSGKWAMTTESGFLLRQSSAWPGRVG
jgi:hypothetical protein